MKTTGMLEVVTAAALALGMFSGCDPAAPAETDSAESVGTARLTVVDDGHAAGAARVTAREALSGKVVQEAAIKLEGQSAVDLTLRPGDYVFDIQAFADKAASSLLCSRTAQVAVSAKLTAKIDVKVMTDAGGAVNLGISGTGVNGSAGAMAGSGATVGGGASGGATAGGSATVEGGAMAGGSATAGDSATAGGSATVGAGAGGASGGAMAGGSATVGAGGASAGAMAGGSATASGGASAGAMAGGSATVSGGASAGAMGNAELCVPVIGGVDVSFTDTKVKINIKASASLGGELTFVWSGAGFKGSVKGAASAELDAADILLDAGKTTKIIVQSKDGVAVQVKVAFDVASHLLGALKLAGTVKTTVSAAAALAVSATACVDAHAKCTAECDAKLAAGLCSVEAHASCMVECAVNLSVCCGP